MSHQLIKVVALCREYTDLMDPSPSLNDQVPHQPSSVLFTLGLAAAAHAWCPSLVYGTRIPAANFKYYWVLGSGRGGSVSGKEVTLSWQCWNTSRIWTV